MSHNYHFTPCCNCGAMPTVADTELCSVCCFGEANSIYDWIWEDWGKNKKARNYAREELRENKKYGLRFVPEIEQRLKEIAGYKV